MPVEHQVKYQEVEMKKNSKMMHELDIYLYYTVLRS